MDAQQIFQNLKSQLKSRGLTYRELGKLIGLSEPSIKRLFGQSDMDLSRLLQICRALDINLSDLTAGAETLPHRLSQGQEATLASDEKLFIFFVLLTRKWTTKQILSSYRFSPAEANKYLNQLARLKLIEWLPQDRVKLKVSDKVEWMVGGPIMQMHERTVQKDFFEYRFQIGGERLTFMTWEVSSSTLEIMGRRWDRCMKDLEAIASADYSLDKKQTQSVALLAGLRPWILPSIGRLKR